MTIPKIIHHIAPKDQSRWHPMWKRCYPTWKEQFPGHDHMLWNDEEDINTLVRDHYPQYWDLFQEFPAHIMRVDFVRFCILHKYGGVYVDMDMFCYKNFHREMRAPVIICEAPYGEEFLESSLMASEPGHQFWFDCMDASRKQYNEVVKKYGIKIPFNNSRHDQYLLQSACGPNLICRVFKNWVGKGVATFPGVVYNNHGLSYHQEYRTKHMMTGMWGKEAVDELDKHKGEKKLGDFLEEVYMREMRQFVQLEGLGILDFDFFHDYTNGGMKTHFEIPSFESETHQFSYE